MRPSDWLLPDSPTFLFGDSILSDGSLVDRLKHGTIAVASLLLFTRKRVRIAPRVILVSLFAMYWLGLAVLVVSGIFVLGLSQYAYHGNAASLFIGPVLALSGGLLATIRKSIV